MFRIATAWNCGSELQLIWKEESSRARTSNFFGFVTASTAVVPTLPQAIPETPAAIRIDSSIWMVVVLPFVPVTATQVWSRLISDLSIQAKSISLIISTPFDFRLVITK